MNLIDIIFYIPHRVKRKIANWITKQKLKHGIRFIAKTNYTNSVTGHIDEIQFSVRSYKEYKLRAQLSYTAEKSTMYWIDNIIKPNEVVYDIGANIGAYSLLIGKRIKDSKGAGIVYAIEPESQNFESLNLNILLNKLSEQVLSIPLAFADKLQLNRFYLSSNEPGSATHGFGKPESEGIEFVPTHIQGMLGISLNEFVRLDGVQFPNHIKIDVDGLEMQIVQNMKALLSDRRLKSVIVELKDSLSDGKIEEVLLSNNFRVAFEEKVGEHDGVIKNILFVKESNDK